MSDIRYNFPRNLRRIRVARKLTQEQLGFEVGTNQTLIALYERGVRAPNVYNAAEIADALGVNINELLN
jgi:transcriptional regulator with XRE-family HTH domain